MLRILYFCAVPIFVLLTAFQAQAQDRYYAMIFSSQQMPPDPRFAHSFAIFVHETCVPGGRHLDLVTISWLAATEVVRVNALRPEDGRNFDIHSTLAWAYCTDQRVSLWGPYEIEPNLYCRAVKQYQLLQSGKVRYKANDAGYPTNRVSNCIHAVASVGEGYRVRVASPGWGETASYAITLGFERYYLNTDVKHLWIVRALGLGKYPIIYRDLEAPRSGAILSLMRMGAHQVEKRLSPAQILDNCP